jgi:hypothetical protein
MDKACREAGPKMGYNPRDPTLQVSTPPMMHSREGWRRARFCILWRMGIVDWIRRGVGHIDGDGSFRLQQETDACHMAPAAH